jgi:hypothetical protein
MRNGRRWQPNQVKGLAQLQDLNAYPVSFVIKGNHEDPNGNAVPYERMTQRSKRKDLRALRYKAWKLYVLQCFTEQARQGFPCDADGGYRLDVKCFFVGEGHGDPENVRKGIQDALFAYGDKHVTGAVEMEHVKSFPRVEIKIDRLPLQDEGRDDA